MLGHIIQHIIYTVSTFYILSKQYIHSIYTVSKCLHSIYTVSTQYLHPIYLWPVGRGPHAVGHAGALPRHQVSGAVAVRDAAIVDILDIVDIIDSP